MNNIKKISVEELKDAKGGLPYEKPVLIVMAAQENCNAGDCNSNGDCISGCYNFGGGCIDGEYNNKTICSNGYYDSGYCEL